MNATETRSVSDGSDTPGPTAGPAHAEPDPSIHAPDSDDIPPEPEGIALIDRAGHAIDLAWLQCRVGAAAAQIGPVRRLDVRLVDDAGMAALHARHCGDETTTDVLTFPASAPGEPIDADIAVCVDVAARAATQRGHAVEREVLLYVLHGLLHCAGHDDHTKEGFDAMHAREDEILAAIGVGATFRDDDGRET